MANGILNATKLLQRQGLDPTMLYEAIVVNNNDNRKLWRIQARVPVIMDGWKDADLPWASPNFNHVQGSTRNGTKWSGIGWAPKNGHKIGLRFPLGDPHKPIWTSFPVDDQTKLPSGETNYPDRVVMHLANGFYVIVDTRTNEFFWNIPGDMNHTILGDVNQYIVGNQNLTVTSNKNDIAGYLLNAPDTVLKSFNASPTKKINFPGLLRKSGAGNSHTTVTGDQTMLIKGNRKTVVMGSDTLEVKQNKIEKVSGLSRSECARSETNG